MKIIDFLEQICDDDPSNWRNDYRYSQIIKILKESDIKFEEVQYNNGAAKNIYVHYGKPFVNIFGAHYDIVPNVQGALDNGASIAELIGLAINLKEHAVDDTTIAFLDNEEFLGGFGDIDDVGSKCMAQNELKDDYKRSIILDVCARGDVILTREDCDIDFSGYKHDVQPMPVTDDWVINSTVGLIPKDKNGEASMNRDDRSLLLSVLPKSELKLHDTWRMLHTSDDNMGNVNIDTLKMMTSFIINLAHETPQKS